MKLLIYNFEKPKLYLIYTLFIEVIIEKRIVLNYFNFTLNVMRNPTLSTKLEYIQFYLAYDITVTYKHVNYLHLLHCKVASLSSSVNISYLVLWNYHKF